MQTIFAFVVAIALLVAVHEWGHFAMARACGVKVLRFAVGFGPTLWSWTSPRTGTEFAIGALPVGGYVKMLDEREAPVDKAELHRAFNTQSLMRRALIVLAGPVANLVFAVLLYSAVNWMGVEQAQAILSKPLAGSVAAKAGFMGGERVLRVGFDEDHLDDVVSFEDFRWWLTRGALAHKNVYVEIESAPSRGSQVVLLPLSGVDARIADVQLFRNIGILGPYSEARLGDILADGAASAAALHLGDLVVSVDGQPVSDGAELRERIRNSGKTGIATKQQWQVLRQDQPLTLSVTPKIETVDGQTIGRVGAMIGAPPALTMVRFGVMEGINKAVERTAEVSLLTLRMMGQIATGQSSIKNLSGPITIADYAGKSAALGVNQFFIFLALISISLGVLNLLPVPVLDGGHLMYYLWEAATGRPVSERSLEWLQRLGLGALLLMMCVAFFNDLVRVLG